MFEPFHFSFKDFVFFFKQKLILVFVFFIHLQRWNKMFEDGTEIFKHKSEIFEVAKNLLLFVFQLLFQPVIILTKNDAQHQNQI